MFHKSVPKLRLSFMELEISLGRAGQFNLEALYHSVGGDGGGKFMQSLKILNF